MAVLRQAAVFLAYIAIAAAFAWPLPLHVGSAFPGDVAGDLGVYVWNLWVFRHEIVAHGHLPFMTVEILPLAAPVPLALHNYTTAANAAAFFLLPVFGTVATFNLLTLLSSALAAYGMFLLARRVTGDSHAAWVAGLAFGFCPFMNARATAHFSLVQAAPLPLFILLFDRFRRRPSFHLAVATGACVAWAFLSDPYYAVYCLLISGAMLVHAACDVRIGHVCAPSWPRHALTALLVCLAGLIAGIVIRGGGRFELFGLRVSMTRLYTPVLVFTVLLLFRLGLSIRPYVTLVGAPPPLRAVVVLGLTCAVLLSPVLSALSLEFRRSGWINPPTLWRSSPPGADLLSFFLPNPLHPWWRHLTENGLAREPGGFVENVVAIPWTVILIVSVGAVSAWARLPRFWIVLTAFFALLALGPFVHAAGVLTYVPGPWALLRYVPVIGAARMPQRFAIVVMIGMAMLMAHVVRDLRLRARRAWVVTAVITVILAFELVPAPRPLYSASVPSVYEIIARDPRPVRVLNLPFGLRDGLSSHGNTNAAWQYYQTVHQKPIMGGYLSRLPKKGVDLYSARPVIRKLFKLSAGDVPSAEKTREAAALAHEMRHELNIGYVVIDSALASPELAEFARQAFDLEFVAVDGTYQLFRSRLLDR